MMSNCKYFIALILFSVLPIATNAQTYISINGSVIFETNISEVGTIDTILVEIEKLSGTSNYTLSYNSTSGNYTRLVNKTDLGDAQSDIGLVNFTAIYANDTAGNIVKNATTDLQIDFARTNNISVFDNPDPVTNNVGQTALFYTYWNASNDEILTGGDCNLRIFETDYSMSYSSSTIRYSAIISTQSRTPGTYSYNITCTNTSYQTQTNTSGLIAVTSGTIGVETTSGGGGGGIASCFGYGVACSSSSQCCSSSCNSLTQTCVVSGVELLSIYSKYAGAFSIDTKTISNILKAGATYENKITISGTAPIEMNGTVRAECLTSDNVSCTWAMFSEKQFIVPIGSKESPGKKEIIVSVGVWPEVMKRHKFNVLFDFDNGDVLRTSYNLIPPEESIPIQLFASSSDFWSSNLIPFKKSLLGMDGLYGSTIIWIMIITLSSLSMVWFGRKALKK